jgi:UDP-N-acetylmuramoyl-tripeptide--D-alanyl-D-alanine ligase
MAIEVLAKMPGKKIVVTSGMIELGSKSYEENKKLGVEIAEAKIDEVILIGKNQTEPINDGLVESGYNKKKIHVLNNVMDAFPLMRQLKEGDTYVLLQSDLPDTFNEK